MIDKKKIKIVKRGAAVAANSKKGKASGRRAAREVVSTVSEWVSDLKQRKSEETRAALDLLFAANRQASES